ncbi:MAG: ABC transporter ATP-binding protein [Symbiobacteriaceae bacterium]
MSGPVIRCAGLSKRFAGVVAVQDLDLEVERGQVLVLVGPSGCGKTTTLRLIAGFEVPDAGVVELSGTVVAGGRRFVPPERRRVGFVFQEYALFPHMTVAENVAYGLPRGPERQRRVREVIELVRLQGLEGRYPHELSGGQQQRVALARALAPRPEILLLDEPFSNLDADLRRRVREEVRDILRQTGTTAIFVTHDRREALNLGDRVAVMNAGRIEQVGTPDEVYYEPATPFVAQFMGPASFLPGRVRRGGIETEVGILPQQAGLPEGAPVRVLVRPDDVHIRPSAAGRGVIVRRERRAGFFRYHVRLDTGTVLESELVHVHDYPVGTRVEVTLDAGHPLRWFPAGEEASGAGASGPEPAPGTSAAGGRMAAGPGMNGDTGPSPRVRVTSR